MEDTEIDYIAFGHPYDKDVRIQTICITNTMEVVGYVFARNGPIIPYSKHGHIKTGMMIGRKATCVLLIELIMMEIIALRIAGGPIQ